MEYTIEEVQPKKSCKTCKSGKSLNSLPKGMLALALYFLFSAVYGTIEIIKDIISLF